MPYIDVAVYFLGCYPAPGPDPNPIALASRWLAYSDKKVRKQPDKNPLN